LVVKIEDRDGGGDPVRHLPPLAGDAGGVFFHALNRGKRSVALDLNIAGHRTIDLYELPSNRSSPSGRLLNGDDVRCSGGDVVVDVVFNRRKRACRREQ
jgi:hypothetical protein